MMRLAHKGLWWLGQVLLRWAQRRGVFGTWQGRLGLRCLRAAVSERVWP
jgi:hypothetical protein